MTKDNPFRPDDEPMKPYSALEQYGYTYDPVPQEQAPLTPVQPQQQQESVFGDPSKQQSQGFWRDLWNNFSRISHNRSRQYTPEELERFRKEVEPPDFESKASIGQQLENLGEVSASGLNSLSYPLYKATNDLPLPGLRLAARTFYGDLPLWAASLPSAITASAGRMIYPVELAMKSDEDEGVVQAREQLLEKNQGLPWKPDDPANFVGLGTVPGKNFSLGTFAGKEFAERLWAAGIKKPLETLSLAKDMEKQGKSPAEIWTETAKINMAENNNYIGWEKNGKDWKLEIHDQATFNKDGPEFGPLTESYRNPPVEKGFDLNEITLRRNPKEFGGEYNADFVNPEIGVGTRAFQTKTQNPNVFGKEWSPRSVASHEVQHFIQDVEGWQNGSNPDAILKGTYGPEIDGLLKKRQLEIYHEAVASDPNLQRVMNSTDPAVQKRMENHRRTMLDAARTDAAHELYERVAGEVEARNVQTRLDMTPEERAAKRPELTEDVPRDQQILDRTFEPVVAKSEPPPINPRHLTEEWDTFAQRVPKEPRPINDKLSLVAEHTPDSNYVNYYLVPKGKVSPWDAEGNSIAVGRFVVRRGQNGGIEITNALVSDPAGRRQGTGTKIYDLIEKDFKGADLMPSPWNQLSDEAFNFWNKRSPEKLQWQRDQMQKYERFDMYPERKVGTRLPDTEPMYSKYRDKSAMETALERAKADAGEADFDAALRQDAKERMQKYIELKNDKNAHPADIVEAGDALVQTFELAGLPTDKLGKRTYINSPDDIIRSFKKATPEELASYWMRDEKKPPALESRVPDSAIEEIAARNEKEAAPPAPPSEPPPPTTTPPEPPIPADRAKIVPSQPRNDPLTFDKAYTAAKDDLHPIRRMEEKLLDGKRGTLAETDQSPYQLARLTRGLEGRVQQAVRYNMYRFKDLKNVGPGLEEILRPIKMKDRDAFEQYLVYKRVLELNSRGIETGFEPANAAKFVRENAKRFDETAKKVTRFAQQGLEYLRDSGMISKDAYQRMVDANKDYAPFYRLMEDKSDITSIPNTLRNPVKEIRGSERDVISPLESIVRNIYAFIGIAERNRVLNAMKDLADANPAMGKALMQRVVSKTEMEGLKKAGANTADLQVFKPDVFHPSADEIVLYRNGERQTYRVEPEVAAAVKNLNREELNFVVKMISKPAQWLRAGATLAPEFIARNPVRDQFSAGILSHNNYLPVVSFLEGMAHSIMGGKSKQYQAALKGGGFNANLVSMDRKYINDNLMRLQDPTVMGRIKNVIHSPIEALRKMSELTENATRMGEFLQARRNNKSIFNSAYDMREVTLDFARMGAKGRAMNAITAFWNANMEGTDRFARSFATNPYRTALKTAAGIALPSALLWWATKDDERIKEVPKWERDTFWIVPMDDWQPIDADAAAKIPKAYKRQIDGQWFQNKGEIIRIPKPFTEGIMFGSGMERLLEAQYGNDPKAWKDFGKSLKGAIFPNMIPTAVLPPLEVGFGRNWFLDRDIVPKYLQKVDPREQSNPYTSETAKFLGRQVSKIDDETSLGSPLVLEHIYRGYTGGLGKLALEGLEKGLEKTGVTSEKNWPTNKYADTPLLRAFASRHPSSGAESIQQFYDEYEKREKTKNTAKLLDTRGDTDGARKIREERALANATSTHRQIGAMNKEVRRVYDDKKLSPDDKREKIDSLYLQMINLAQKANEMFRATEKKPKPAAENPFRAPAENPFRVPENPFRP